MSSVIQPPVPPGTQNYKNHARMVPAFHLVAGPILLVNLLWTGYRLATALGLGTAIEFLLAIGLIIIYFCARLFALKVQDRVIRLEMRLRLTDVLPADLRPRIAELTLGQLLALRFASDEELPDLTRRVLDERLTDRDAIKRQVRQWQADTLRV